MYEASLESVLRTILIIMLVYYGFKILIRWFGPKILRYFLKKIGGQFQQQFNQSQATSKKKGDVEIDKKPSKSAESNKNVGEYIDYEEID